LPLVEGTPGVGKKFPYVVDKTNEGNATQKWAVDEHPVLHLAVRKGGSKRERRVDNYGSILTEGGQ